MSARHDITITPDLSTRESVMVAAGRVQLAVTNPDDYTAYIKVEAKVKNPEGAPKRYSPAPLDQATHVFLSEKGYGTPSLGTYYPPRAGYGTGRLFTDLSEADAHFKALQVAVEYVNGGMLPLGWAIEAEDRCGVCGRKLEDPVSVARGIGPECAGKPTGTKVLHVMQAEQPEQLELEQKPGSAEDLLVLNAKISRLESQRDALDKQLIHLYEHRAELQEFAQV